MVVTSVLSGVALADVYLHTPSGSNNRLDEANRDRNNGNRMFDSQNNNRGGYNVQSLRYVAGSEVKIKWTNQHSCGNPNTDCQVILQFMCDPKLRDGTTTNRIPETEYADSNPKYGRHESYEWYRNCQMRERNKGLFTASQRLQKDRAQHTRQNPNGNRNGFECPEERDYYPYWHPTPWIDIAVLTDRTDLCPLYRGESQNVKEKFACHVNTTLTRGFVPSTRSGCLSLGGEWRKHRAHGFPAPECIESPWTRDNHLGLTADGELASYTWTVPDPALYGLESANRCALRIRYNITTNDYPAWGKLAANATHNDRDGLALNLTRFYEAKTPYAFKNNPDVDFGLGVEFELAVNTAQFGRTFQDRSHRFAILPPLPADVLPCKSTRIHNLNIRGKRGNIVQVFPGTEYFFTPDPLECNTCDLVHFQWSGSNTNPNNNDGQGQQGSDRHNMVEVADQGRTYPLHVAKGSLWNATEQYVSVAGTPIKHRHHGHMSKTDPHQLGGEMSELDDAGTYFDGGIYRCAKPGQYAYMCSRDQNFSNRNLISAVNIEESDEHDDDDVGIIVGAVASALIALAILAIALMALIKHLGSKTFTGEAESTGASDLPTTAPASPSPASAATGSDYARMN
jgi:hypothetical protein